MRVKFEGRCIASYTGVIDVPDSIGKDGKVLEEYISSHLDEVSEHINMEYSSDMPYREDNVRCINEIEEKETDYER